MIQAITDRITKPYRDRIAELEAEVTQLTAELAAAQNVTAPPPPPAEEPAKRIFSVGKPFRIGAHRRRRKAIAEFERNKSARRVAAAVKAEQEFRDGVHHEIGQDVLELPAR